MAQQQEDAVPDGDAVSIRITWTALEMEQARDFEALVDYRLAQAKRDVMEVYLLHRPPTGWPFDEEQDRDV